MTADSNESNYFKGRGAQINVSNRFLKHALVTEHIEGLDEELLTNSKTEIFIKRKNSKYTYNIGCIDGVGCNTIKKRLYNFFSDCPSLLQMIKKNQIKETNLIKIIDYYHKSCNN